MDSLREIANVLIDWVVAIGANINNSDIQPTTAFVLGIFTMFLVDKVLQKIFSWLKWVILIGILAGLGFSITDLLGIFDDVAPAVPKISVDGG